jgi:hypothetical protein
MEVKEIPSFSEAQVRWIEIPKRTEKKVGKQTGGMVSTTISAFIWKLSLSQPDLPITGGRRIQMIQMKHFLFWDGIEENKERKPELFICWKLLNEEFPYARNEVQPQVFEST